MKRAGFKRVDIPDQAHQVHQSHDQNDQHIEDFNNSITSTIVFEEDLFANRDKYEDNSMSLNMTHDSSIQDMSILVSNQKSIADDIKRRQLMEKANEAAISRMIKEDAMSQFSMDDAVVSMTKLIQKEEETFNHSFEFNESMLSSAFNQNHQHQHQHHQQEDPSSHLSDADLKRCTIEDDKMRAKELFQLCVDTAPNESGIVDPSKWDLVRDFMLSYPELMQRAAQVRDHQGVTALHQVCRHQPPVNVIELFVSCGGLEALHTPDKLERLPIHYACRHNCSVEVINALVNLYPDCRTKQDIEGGTPLHHAIANKNAPVGMVKGVCSEGAASTVDRWGMVPLHHAVTREFSKTQSIKVVMTAYPQGLAHLDLKGRAPIHWLVKCCQLENAIELLDLAFALDPALGKGDMGLHLLRLIKTSAENNIKSANVQACLNMIIRLNPTPTDAFTKVIKTLPRWLDRGKRRTSFFRRNATKGSSSK